MGIFDKLTYLTETKNQLKTNLNNKGVTVSDTDTFRSYADKLSSLPFKFSTTTALEEATTQTDGDSALVYRNNTSNLTSTLETTILKFPETKSISFAPTTAVTGTLVAVDGSSLPLVNISATTTSLIVNITTKTGETHTVEYTGVTSGSLFRTTKYTRQTAIEKVELGAPVKFSGTWDVRYATLQGVDFFYGGAYEYKDEAWSRLDEGSVLDVVPSTNVQTFTDYYNTVNVSPVDNTIDTNIVPENIKKDITILGVVGTLEAGGGPTEGAKIFTSIDEMNNATGNEIGDLAVIYTSTLGNMTATTETSAITFPDEVVLPSAFTSSVYCMFRGTDDSSYLDAQAQLSKTRFRLSIYTESSNISVEYTSTLGKTYTRTDGGDKTIQLPGNIKCYYAEEWDDNLGYFMLVPSAEFGGLFTYDQYTSERYMNAYRFGSGVDGTWTPENTYIGNLVDKLQTIRGTVPDILVGSTFRPLHEFTVEKINDDNFKVYTQAHWNTSSSYVEYTDTGYIGMDDDEWYLGLDVGGIHNEVMPVDTLANLKIDQYKYMLIEWLVNGDNISVRVVPTSEFTTKVMGAYTKYVLPTAVDKTHLYFGISINDTEITAEGMGYRYVNAYGGKACSFGKAIGFIPAPNTLSATPDDVYGKTYYSRNGIETGTLDKNTDLTLAEIQKRAAIWDKYSNLTPSTTDLSNCFREQKTIKTIPYINTSNVTDTSYMFYYCDNLEAVPLMDTSNVTDMTYMFGGCKKLKEVPLFDTSKVTSMAIMLYACSSLTSIPAFDTSSAKDLHSFVSSCTGITEAPWFDTSKATNVQSMFSNCSNLVTVPAYSLASVASVYQNLQSMYYGCTSLSNESLNNILASCSTISSSYNSTKTLKHLGLTSEQATTCTSLSNWSAASAKGWTTGY